MQGKRKLAAAMTAMSILAVGAGIGASEALAADTTGGGSPPPTLTGESLGGAAPASATFSSVNCDPAGTSSFDFSASGPATGPYPGTFHEWGHATIGPQTTINSGGYYPPLGTVERLDVAFVIDSATGHVVGYKTLSMSVEGQCQAAANNPGFQGSVYDANATEHYSAAIRPPTGGTYLDHGNVPSSQVVHEYYTNQFGGPFSYNFVYETFASEQATTSPIGGGGQ